MLDVGTENEALLADPLYMGLRRRRLRGREFDALVDEFMVAAGRRWPNVLIQFEDFAGSTAFDLLETYRDRACTFNDDMQGTAAMALGGIYSALRVTGGSLREQTLLFLGAGEAGTGIGDLAVAAMVDEGASLAEARAPVLVLRLNGLVVKGRAALRDHNLPFAHERAGLDRFVDAVEALEPTAIIGVSTRAQAVRPRGHRGDGAHQRAADRLRAVQPDLALRVHRRGGLHLVRRTGDLRQRQPVPAGQHRRQHVRARPGQQRLHLPRGWTGRHRQPRPPGHRSRCSARAARALAAEATAADLELGRIYPSLARIRAVSAAIATSVAEVAFDDGLADIPRPGDLHQLVRANMWAPVYPTYVADAPGTAGRGA